MLASYDASVDRGQMAVASGTTVDYDTVDVYQKIIGTWSDGCLNNFTLDDANDRLIFNGNDGSCFLFVGSSEVQIDNAGTIYYALYLNGVLATGAETEHTFSAPAKTSSIAINKIITLNNGDYVEVWTKCSGLYTITIKALTVCFWGE